MKLPCEMIRDLLPLYHDNVCSEVSKTIVTEHLKTCEACTKVLDDIHTEMDMPKLEADEGKPLRSIQRKWKKTTHRRGILIGLAVFLVVLTSWVLLTQTNHVSIPAEDYTVHTVLQFSNGMIYMEYSHPYALFSTSADIHRTEDGAVHIIEKRPRICRNGKTIRSRIIDPVHDTMYSNTGKEVPITAFYLGCPDEGNAVLVWSKDMKVPMATPEQEMEYLYQNITNW